MANKRRCPPGEAVPGPAHVGVRKPKSWVADFDTVSILNKDLTRTRCRGLSEARPAGLQPLVAELPMSFRARPVRQGLVSLTIVSYFDLKK